ncbi:MAG TPA: hypothetical protein VFD85_09800 [Gemmatimonadales bacterium]|nr:hypothetical protein [Gemmatimonadales bacterium]HZH41294.1 hypothetical protein [Gemmatimonadales bacterium]
MADANDRVVVWYAVWATVCAAVAGIVVLLFDSYLFSHLVHRAAVIRNVVDEGSGVLAISAGQGAVALVAASALLQFGRNLQPTVLLGLLIGAFDFLFDLLQVFVPATEVEWKWKLVIALVAAIVITVSGSRKAAAAG